ncbi:uncharacterized protein NFIA_108930 [Aspergillus fischeri NRRL 181]|uniref:SAP domain-containing protein n=1 Tax=Neosartorya fischeri (strain ATCC 1020 / DSM 3700 / CBS 544.65 / FGSC A1164 / JCM 1740 / NRRL 181 / WB 181) TaxID=331117 RepID=A1CXP8_NEOFI|nr:conserved hypothetical protein [Aspergillus fischeri NRRL 181]EAW25400.1 conserved hypothetical protein [Aspergillus fischeri NRRL 181]KAG2024562.1 hypothetical protein GB937_003754 [Aspergillus fischeri]
MRISSRHLSSYTWLNSLRASQLQRIAQATGIQSSGTKACLIARLKEELPQREPEKQTSTCARTSPGTNTGAMSILSIDMGIQNLAYAHLLVPRDSHTATAGTVVKLNAWRRLAVSDALLDPAPDSLGKIEGGRASNASKLPGKVKEKEKHTFSPSEYARTAYALVTGLLHAYRPSHVLIERQRFRSGGGSAVQEWTLRVGVFEGMLYAVLHALGQAGEGAEAGMRPVVLGVEPRRVGAYWEGRLGVDVDAPKKKKASSREGKKIKINLAGEWLRAGMGGEEAGSGSASGSPFQLSVADDPELRALVDAYLRRWASKSNPGRSVSRARAKAEGQAAVEEDGAVVEPPDVRKMDDLADCLVQGVTWLEWQAMRQRISTEGLDAVLQLESGKL